jgi:hypothetical protein
MATLRVKKRRSRLAVALLQGVAIYFVGYFPALSWGNPMIAVGMTSLMMILVAARLSSVRQGFVRGLILGTLAGMAIWGGLDQRLKLTIAARELAAQPPQAGPAEGDNEESDPSVEDTCEAAAADDEAAGRRDGEAPEVAPFPQEDRDAYEKLRRSLPYRAIPPPMVICPVIGMLFAHLADKRRTKVRSMWD